MKRINSSGCGYSYNKTDRLVCNSIKSLHPYFANTPITYIDINVTEPEWVNFTLDAHALDNYGQLPQKLEGFIMKLSPVIDMSGSTSGYPAEVPEIECRVNMDPFTDYTQSVLNTDLAYTYNPKTANTGFLDLFTQVSDYHTDVYADVNGTTMTLSNKIPVMIDSGTAKNPYTVKPGILEPMLDTQLPNIDVKTIPAVDAGLDGAFLALDRLQQWRSVIDTRITNLTYAVEEPNIFPQDSPCDNFKIELLEGEGLPPAYQSAVISGGTDSATIAYPLYSIADGRITINGATVAITGFTGMNDGSTSTAVVGGTSVPCAVAPFAAYLKVSSGAAITANTLVYRKMSPALSSDSTLYYIGGVTEVFEPVSAGASKGDALFQIDQGDCIEDIEYITGTSTGYVYMNVTNGGRQYTTDPLLNSLPGSGYPFVPPEDASRGVQASAIRTYVDNTIDLKIAGITTGGNAYDGPFKVAINPEDRTTVHVYDGRFPDSEIAGYAFIDGKSKNSVAKYAGSLSGGTQSIFIVAYNQDRASTTENFIYVNGMKYTKEAQTTLENYTTWKSGASEVYTTAAIPATGSTVYSKTQNNELVVVGYVASPDVPVNYYYTLSESAHISPPAFWYTRLATIIDGGVDAPEVQQVHYGDLNVISGGTATTITGSTYNGPFMVDGDGLVDCPVCELATIGGHYWINGNRRYDVATSAVNLTAATQDVYLHIRGVGDYSIDTTSSIEGNTIAYNVWLAHINGATVTGGTIDAPIEGSTETTPVNLYGGGTVTQIQHGDVYVDGRWM